MKVISETRKAPEVERVASSDKARPVLSYVHLNVENGTLEATDSHKAVVIPVEIEDGDTSGPIPPEALKAQRKASKYGAASLSANGGVSLTTPEGEQTWVRPDAGVFPNLAQVTAAEYSRFRICLNPKYLLELAHALGNPEQVVVEFARPIDKVEGDDTGAFLNPLKPMRVTVPSGGDSYGILMPILIP